MLLAQVFKVLLGNVLNFSTTYLCISTQWRRLSIVVYFSFIIWKVEESWHRCLDTEVYDI